MIDAYVVAVIVLLVLEIFTIGFIVGFWFAEKEGDKNDRKQKKKI